MSYYVVDVEADSQSPASGSMVCFGAVKVVEPVCSEKFYGEVRPIRIYWDPKALAVCGITREQHLTFPEPFETMTLFRDWVGKTTKGRPIFISDNPAYDWQWINYYMDMTGPQNPFGWSARRIGDLYCGLVKDSYARWKHLRKTPHDHNPVNDALGNAEALIRMKQELGLKIGFE